MKRLMGLLPGSLVIAAMAGGTALAADVPAPVYRPLVATAPVFTWTGLYVGANGGYGWGRASSDLTETQVVTATVGPATATATTTNVGSDKAKLNGGFGGVQAGYNWQDNSFLWGLEGDIQSTGQRGGVTICPAAAGAAACTGVVGTTLATANYSLQWFSTVRGRVGVTFDRVLFYATGGLAVGGIKTDITDGFVGLAPPAFPVATSSSTAARAGWVAGVGVEGAIGGGWSVKAEYLHMDFGSVDRSASGTGASSFTIGSTLTTLNIALTASSHVRLTDDVVRAGLNYNFDWAGL
jgi:outer membrane immunogenic protein